MHYGVSVLQTIFVLLVFLILIRYLWGMFLNLKQEEHRNKILVSLSIHYLIL